MREINNDELSRELEQVEREKRLDAIKANQRRKELISDIKNGLGDQIRENPSFVEIIEKPKETFKEKLIKFFNRF